MIDFDWGQALSHLIHLTIAYVLALPIGWNRECEARSAGIRTYPLVAIGACGFLLVGMAVLENRDTNAHLMKGLIGGLGFLGGGAILKSNGSVMGMATAASIWNTGAIGMAVAYGRYEIAAVLSLLNVITLRGGKIVKEVARTEKDSRDASDS